jgi:hypothetical protein
MGRYVWVQADYYEQLITLPSGISHIGGADGLGVLGRGGVDRVLRIAPGLEPLLAAGKLLCPASCARLALLAAAAAAAGRVWPLGRPASPSHVAPAPGSTCVPLSRGSCALHPCRRQGSGGGH